LGKFVHGRELAPIGRRGIIRPNRDTLYSLAVFDVDAGPVTVTLPDPGKRYMVTQVANEDQYTPVVYYGASSHTLTKEGIGTRYGIVVVPRVIGSSKPARCPAGPRLAGCHQGEPTKSGNIRRP